MAAMRKDGIIDVIAPGEIRFPESTTNYIYAVPYTERRISGQNGQI